MAPCGQTYVLLPSALQLLQASFTTTTTHDIDCPNYHPWSDLAHSGKARVVRIFCGRKGLSSLTGLAAGASCLDTGVSGPGAL